MVLQEVCAALTRLLDNNESIVITDSPDVHAYEILHYLTVLLRGLKCDYRIQQITSQSYELTLYQ